MVFEPKFNWVNSPSTATPITAAELIRIEAGIAWIQEVKPRTKTAAEWTAGNEILVDDEIGLELDTLKSKVGDGVTAWNSLAYSSNPLVGIGGVDLTPYLLITDAANTYAQVGHVHAGQYGAGNLAPNGDFTLSGADWDTTNKVGTPTITYETSPLDSGLAAKMVFAAAGNEQVFLSIPLTIPGEDVNGLSGTFQAHSTKPCSYSVELLTTNILSDPDYDSPAETLEISHVIAVGTLANADTPVAWSAVIPIGAVKVRVAIRIKAGAGQTTPITAYLDNVSYTWVAGSASTLSPQAQGTVATKVANQTGIVTATPTKLLIDSADIDRGGYLDVTNHQIEIPSKCSGLHTLHAEIPFASNGTGSRRIVLKKNTVEVKAGTGRANADYQSVPTLNYTADLKNGDVLELFVEQTSGGNLDVLAAGLAVSIVRHDRQPQEDTIGPSPAPVAGFTRTPASGTAPFSVTCTSTATGDISSITYNYGDGTGELISPTHVYTGDPAFSGDITQTVTGPGGSDTFTRSITVSAPVTGDVPLVRSRRQTAKPDAATSVTVDMPTTAPVAGDKLILYAFQRGAASVFTGPAGYTALGALFVGTNGVCRAWEKTAVGGDANPVITSNADAAMVAGVIVITAGSWKTSDPWSVDWSAEGVSAPAANYSQPAVTTSDNNALRIAIAAEPYTTITPVLTRPEDFVATGAQTNGLKSSNGQHIAVMPAVRVVPTAGIDPAAIWTTTGNTPMAWLSMQLAVTAANATQPQPETGGLFPADPGPGKTITTWIQHNGNYSVWKDQLALVRGVSYPGGVADANRGPIMFKRYDPGHNGNLASSLATVQDGRILFITYNNVKQDSLDILAGLWDDRMDEDLATLKSWKTNYNAIVWTNLLHEPENNGWDTKADRMNARKAQRYYVDYMRSGGSVGAANVPTNWAFVGPIFIADTLGSALTDFNNGAVRNNPWWEYDPNWKGPEHGPAGYTGYTGWSMNGPGTALNYNSADFYTTNRYADMAGADLYCFHWQYSVGKANPSGFNGAGANPLFDNWEQQYWTSNPNPSNFRFNSGHGLSLEWHTPFERDHYNTGSGGWDNGTGGIGQQHGGERYRMALDDIYGVADDTRMPIFIAEGAYPIHQTDFTTFAGSDPLWAESLAYYQVILQQFADNRVVGFCFWKSDEPAIADASTIDSGTISTVLGTKGVQINPYQGDPVPGYPTYSYQARYDPTDTRRKLFAVWLDSTLQKKKLRR